MYVNFKKIAWDGDEAAFLLLLGCILVRPFICSPVFPLANFIHAVLLTVLLIAWICIKGLTYSLGRVTLAGLGVFILSLFVALVVSVNRVVALERITIYIDGVLIFLVCHSLDVRSVGRIIRGLVITGVAVSLFAVYQYLYILPEAVRLLQSSGARSFEIEFWKQSRVFFPFYTPNCLAGFLLLVMPLVSVFHLRWPLFVIFFMALLMTGSVGALVSMVVVLVVYAWAARKKLPSEITGLLALTFLGVVIVFLAREGFRNVFFHPFYSLSMRFVYWQEAWQLIRAHIWTGVGLGNFTLSASCYGHQLFLQIWAELGVFAVVAFMAVIFSLLREGMLLLRSNPCNLMLRAFFFSATAFLVQNMVDFSFFLPEVGLTWCVILGLLSNRLFNRSTESMPAI